MADEQNIHAGCLLLDDRGVLITGPAGSGKTTLALALIGNWRASGQFARLVADDRVLVRRRGGRVIGCVPEAIAGLAEAHGLGPRPIGFEAEAVIDLVLELVAPEAAPRFGEGRTCTIAGCELPLLVLAERSAQAALTVVAAQLGLPPFSRREA